jgi:peptide/nickel transport system permease protein
VTSRFGAFVLRRALTAVVLVALVASASLILARLAPGDHLSEFELSPEQLAAERHRLGLDAPLYVQYARWLGGAIRLDLGASTRYPGRPVAALIAERVGNTLLLGATTLAFATVVGVPLGVVIGSRRSGAILLAARTANLVLLSLPPIVLALGLLLFASRTGWFPAGGLPQDGSASAIARSLVLPVLALGLPIAATLERLQARSIRDALADRAILAARARGVPRRRLIWRHAFRLSLTPVLAIYGIIIAALISGSFIVEYLMTWPGLGRLMYDGLVARDANLVAGCAATGAAFLALGVFVSDVLLAAADPRLEKPR